MRIVCRSATVLARKRSLRIIVGARVRSGAGRDASWRVIYVLIPSEVVCARAKFRSGRRSIRARPEYAYAARTEVTCRPPPSPPPVRFGAKNFNRALTPWHATHARKTNFTTALESSLQRYQSKTCRLTYISSSSPRLAPDVIQTCDAMFVSNSRL